MKNTNKKGAMKNFWKNYDPEGYSLWYIEYNNDPNECVTLMRTCIIKGDILEQLKYFKNRITFLQLFFVFYLSIQNIDLYLQ